MNITFKVTKQIIIRTDQERIVRDSLNYLHAVFTFSDEWLGSITAIFKSKSGTFNIILDENNSCLVPWEVLRDDEFLVSVFCGNLITANVVRVLTIKSGYTLGSSSRIPTEDVFNQIMEKIDGLDAEAIPYDNTESGLEAENVQAAIDEIADGGSVVVPEITATATVDSTTGTPSVTVSKTGTDENPHFEFDFHGLKGAPGAQGQPGATGATPNVTATATVDGTTGTPSVNVSKTGTEENPNFAFAFSGLKGENPEGAMLSSIYDSEGAVAEAGGIAEYVEDETSVLLPKSQLGTYPIVPQNVINGVYSRVIGKGTADELADGSVDFTSGGNGGVAFTITLNPLVDNTIKFTYKDMEGSLSYGTFFVLFSGKLIGLDTYSHITDEYTYVFTPEIIAENEIPSTCEVYMSTANVSYNISVTNTYGGNTNAIDLMNAVSHPLVGKKAIFLGDSITALTGLRSWVKKFCDMTRCYMIANVAVAEAVLPDYNNTVYDGDPKSSNQDNNTLGNQVQKIINNAYDAPDLIVIAIGTNSGITADSTRLTEAYYDNGSVPSLASLDKTHCEGAFRYCTETLHNLYPDAVICWCNPIQGAATSGKYPSVVSEWADALKVLTEWGAVNNIETNRCGIICANETGNHEYLQDGLHPNAEGALKIAEYNSAAISKLFLANTAVQ